MEQRVVAPMAAGVVTVDVAAGDALLAGQLLCVLEAMKMEHELRAPAAGRVLRVEVLAGQSVEAGEVLIAWDDRPSISLPPVDETAAASALSTAPAPRPDLQALLERQTWTRDAARPDAVARRRARGQRTARENVDALCDPGSFVEYGALAVAAQSGRRSHADLVRNTPADGLVAGLGSIGEGQFDAAEGTAGTRCVVLAYDATVLAGTQGMRNHQKTDRMLGLALAQRLPVLLFAEGGGGRPGDVDAHVIAGLTVPTFASFARLSGQVPLVGIAAGRCFAGNAALLGCCDVIIATRDSTIGMGGPAMVEGGGLGVFEPAQIGPSAVQSANGVIDLLVDDEPQAAAVARRYLGYFQGRSRRRDADPAWSDATPQALREALPRSRVRAYDMRAVWQLVADTGSLLELRAGHAAGVLTALARIEGRPVGILASNPSHLGGAIDAEAADKAVRFMELCNAHGLPLVSLIDTPGFMVGPQIEAQAQVRRASRMFIAGARLRVPLLAVVLRKAYGLGAMAMTGGGFHIPFGTVAWPGGEFGAMGLEGAVRLGYRKELEAAPAGAQRDALYEELVARQYREGSAIRMAETLEIDAVIDPADTRQWLVAGLAAAASGRRPSAS